MPFETDTSWPHGLITTFERARVLERPVPLRSLADRYYGPYNKLLVYCFGENFDFVVGPQVPPDDTSQGAFDFVNIVVSTVDRLPVLFVEIKDDSHIRFPTKRQKTDDQMRRRYDDILNACPIPKLYGLSILGTKARVYCVSHADLKIHPTFVDFDPNYILPDEYLEDGWSVDILSDKGFLEMKRIIEYIKEESVKKD
ncbi:hypothetical protein C8R45DRAFT_878456 [Mycena sanguinolenta]|nr:hypothetical protein C8R45DRAFT_878456 [Mycena sanguinolenta]